MNSILSIYCYITNIPCSQQHKRAVSNFPKVSMEQDYGCGLLGILWFKTSPRSSVQPQAGATVASRFTGGRSSSNLTCMVFVSTEFLPGCGTKDLSFSLRNHHKQLWKEPLWLVLLIFFLFHVWYSETYTCIIKLKSVCLWNLQTLKVSQCLLWDPSPCQLTTYSLHLNLNGSYSGNLSLLLQMRLVVSVIWSHVTLHGTDPS